MRIFPQLLAVALMFGIAPAFAHDYQLGDIEIGQPWIRATPTGARTGGGFLTLTNIGGEADRLVSVTSPIADRIEFHKMEVTNGIMKMWPQHDGVEIPAGETVELKPGSFHIMFLELTGPVKQGAPVPATLSFERAGTVEVEMAVTAPGAPGPDDHHAHEGGQ